jgi:hypothetical protein
MGAPGRKQGLDLAERPVSYDVTLDQIARPFFQLQTQTYFWPQKTLETAHVRT